MLLTAASPRGLHPPTDKRSMNGNEEATQPTDGIGTIGQRQKCITTTSSTPPPTDDSTRVGHVCRYKGNAGKRKRFECAVYVLLTVRRNPTGAVNDLSTSYPFYGFLLPEFVGGLAS